MDRRLALVLLALAALAIAGGVALALQDAPAARDPAPHDEGAMSASERCAHMPEHCEGGPTRA